MFRAGLFVAIVLAAEELDSQGVFQTDPVTEWTHFGFTVDHTQPNFVRAVTHMFALPRDKVRVIPSNRVSTKFVHSDNVDETAREFEMMFGLSGNLGCFLQAASLSTDAMTDVKVHKVRYDHIITASKYQVYMPLNPGAYLTEEAKDILKGKPDRVVETLGMFYPKEITLGGVFQATYVKHAREQDTAASLQAEVVASGGGLGNSLASSTSSSETKVHSTHKQRGGDTTLWLGLGSHSLDDIDEVQKNWAASVSDENLYPIDFKLAPIWELLSDIDEQQKAIELQEYLENLWIGQRAQIEEWPRIQPCPCLQQGMKMALKTKYDRFVVQDGTYAEANVFNIFPNSHLTVKRLGECNVNLEGADGKLLGCHASRFHAGFADFEDQGDKIWTAKCLPENKVAFRSRSLNWMVADRTMFWGYGLDCDHKELGEYEQFEIMPVE